VQRTVLHRDLSVAPKTGRFRAALELGAVAGWLLSYIWLWSGTVRGGFVLAAAGAFVLAGLSIWKADESLREITVQSGSLLPALRRTLYVVTPALLALLGAATYFGGAHFPSPANALGNLISVILFGVLQEFLLLAFFYRRMESLFGNVLAARVTAAALFAIFHMPNPFLVPVTFAAGLAACWIYRSARNIPIIGTAHGLLSFAMYHALPLAVTHGLRVGPHIG
jgi:membrane protease YdiL (CAAX protease family)